VRPLPFLDRTSPQGRASGGQSQQRARRADQLEVSGDTGASEKGRGISLAPHLSGHLFSLGSGRQRRLCLELLAVPMICSLLGGGLRH